MSNGKGSSRRKEDREKIKEKRKKIVGLGKKKEIKKDE